MSNIKKLIVEYLYRITLLILSVILVIAVLLQILNEQHKMQESAGIILRQIEQILNENQKELADVKEEYRNTCLYSAESIAYLIEAKRSVMYDRTELKKIARLLEVDEIHIFDKSGRIFAGTHPEYYNYTFNSGKQMNFFKPMLKDHTLRMCQDITPNTAEGKQMQYSAVWSQNDEFIVQVGMEPVNVQKATEKNELSYIFSLLRANPEVALYAIDKESGTIMGATDTEAVGRQIQDVGLSQKRIQKEKQGFHAKVNGVYSYCVFRQYGTQYIGRIVSVEDVYGGIVYTSFGLLLSLLLIAFILVNAVTRHIKRIMLDGIDEINHNLREITEGNLNKRVDVQTCLELSELGSHINEMVKSLLSSMEKISYILTKSNTHIGVYEYSKKMKYVRFTEYVSKVFDLDREEMARQFMNRQEFQVYLVRLRQNMVHGEEDIFRVENEGELYVRIEEMTHGNDILGMMIDVTKGVQEKKQLKAERDVDKLTGLYNRFGMEHMLEKLLAQPDGLGHAAFVMIDADGLKGINDTYGHDMGDVYLREIAALLDAFGTKKRLAVRQGGDEYVLFLYGYGSSGELEADIEALRTTQDAKTVALREGLTVPLRYSFGVSIYRTGVDYQILLKEADEKMYESKRMRKKAQKKENL